MCSQSCVSRHGKIYLFCSSDQMNGLCKNHRTCWSLEQIEYSHPSDNSLSLNEKTHRILCPWPDQCRVRSEATQNDPTIMCCLSSLSVTRCYHEWKYISRPEHTLLVILYGTSVSRWQLSSKVNSIEYASFVCLNAIKSNVLSRISMSTLYSHVDRRSAIHLSWCEWTWHRCKLYSIPFVIFGFVQHTYSCVEWRRFDVNICWTRSSFDLLSFAYTK
jgi:hypothetical protein